MHIHICPAEITAFLLTFETAVPYVRYYLCHKARCLGDAIRRRFPVTVWSKVDDEGSKSFDHLEAGHVETDVPTIRSAEQHKVWTSYEWEKQHGYLADDCVIVGETGDEPSEEIENES